MRYLIFLFVFFSSAECYCQSSPVWSTYISSSNKFTVDADGRVFVIGSGMQACGASYVAYLLINNSGNVLWTNQFDSLNMDSLNYCAIEDPENCVSIEGSGRNFAFTTSTGNSIDSTFVVIVNNTGSNVYLSANPILIMNPGNMNDDHVYCTRRYPAGIFKLDTLANVIWNYSGPDSTMVYATDFNKKYNMELLGCSTFENQSDGSLRMIGVDTSGNERFFIDVNLFPNAGDGLDNAWYTSNHQIVGFASTSSFLFKAFKIDTTANVIWQVDLPTNANNVWDSAHQSLHYTTAGAVPQTRRCYKIDAASGGIIDSLVIDSCTVLHNVTIDKHGYIYFGYRLMFAPVPTFRVDRYRPDYTLDWSGAFVDSTAGSGMILNMAVSDSGYVFIDSQHFPGFYVSKFAPPIINSIQENDSQIPLTLFPNPTSASFTYSFMTKKNCQYQITDLQGKTVLSGKCNSSGKGEVDISSLSSSVYFISIIAQDGEILTAPKKIIKIK